MNFITSHCYSLELKQNKEKYGDFLPQHLQPILTKLDDHVTMQVEYHTTQYWVVDFILGCVYL